MQMQSSSIACEYGTCKPTGAKREMIDNDNECVKRFNHQDVFSNSSSRIGPRARIEPIKIPMHIQTVEYGVEI